MNTLTLTDEQLATLQELIAEEISTVIEDGTANKPWAAALESLATATDTDTPWLAALESLATATDT